MPVMIRSNESNASRRRVYFDLRSATDAITPAEDEAGGAPQISIDGGGWTTTGISTLTHIGHGRYFAELTQAAVATPGTRIETRYKSANTIETAGDVVQVVGFDPFDPARLGLTALPTASPGFVNGLPLVDGAGLVAVDVSAILGTALQQSTAGSVAANLSSFFDVHPVTSLTVNDVGGGSGGGWSTTEKEQIRHRLGIDGNAQGPSATPSLAAAADLAQLASLLSSVKSKTDEMDFTAPGLLNVNILAAGGVAVSGPDDLKASAVSVESFQPAALAMLFSVDTGQTFATAVERSVVAEIASQSGSTPAAIADAVWNAEQADFQEPQSMGRAMFDAVRMGVEGAVSDPSASASSFRGDEHLSPADGHYAAAVLVFLTGANRGIARPVAAYSGNQRQFTFAHAFPAAPADGDRFRITGYAPGV